MEGKIINFEKKYDMIEPKDLRIGNYYQGASRGNIEIVTWQTLRDLSEGKLNLLPIPLTEEILLKFRYKKIRDNEFLFDNHFIIFIKESEIDFYLYNSEGNDFFVCEIQFAHELQNLHYSIKKEKITFK